MDYKDNPYRMLSRIGAAVLCISAVLLLSSGCTSKQRVYRVGILSGLDFFANTTTGFKEKMAEMGYSEGKNIGYDCQKTNFDTIVYRRILAKFVAEKVDLIFVFPTEASLEAKAAVRGTTIPVLFANTIIEGTGLIKNLSEPGENITGVRWPGPDLAVKILEILCEVAPKTKRIYLPYQKGYPNLASQLKVLRSAAAAAGIMLIEAPAASVSELQELLNARAASKDIGIDAIMNIPEPLSGTPEAFEAMCTFARKHSLPIGGPLNFTQRCEPLFGVNVDPVAVGRQAAVLADKILRGVPAGSLRVVSAEPHIQINYREIKKRGFKADEGLLSSADEVIR
jgi:putative ABC transport system substrate-binding protein